MYLEIQVCGGFSIIYLIIGLVSAFYVKSKIKLTRGHFIILVTCWAFVFAGYFAENIAPKIQEKLSEWFEKEI